jgi:sulfhydrogenase subunit delta
VSDKARISFHDFACCEGCQLTVLGIGEPLLALLQHVEIVQWREAASEQSDQYDVAIVEGSIIKDSEIPRLLAIRARAKTLVALGSCACLGGPHVSANAFDRKELKQLVFGEQAESFEVGEVRPLHALVKVDIPIYGCPINPDEFLTVMKHVLLGKPYHPPEMAVCYECKRNQYECVYDRGQVCLGPVTRCGCNAICTSKGHRCFGCRGLMEAANVSAARDVLEEHGYTVEEIIAKFQIYSQRAAAVKDMARPGATPEPKGGEPWRFRSNT